MGAAVSSTIDLRLADSMEHFVVDDEFDEVEGNIPIVEKWVNPDLMPVPVVSAEGDVPKSRFARTSRPANESVIIRCKKKLFHPLVDVF